MPNNKYITPINIKHTAEKMVTKTNIRGVKFTFNKKTPKKISTNPFTAAHLLNVIYLEDVRNTGSSIAFLGKS